MCGWQERDTEVQGLQQRLTEVEEAHEEELVDLQATIQSCSAKLQSTKVQVLGTPNILPKTVVLAGTPLIPRGG